MDQRANSISYSPTGVSVYGGGAPSRALAGTAASYVVAGGANYVEPGPKRCCEKRADGKPCTAFAVGGGKTCIGHRNRAEKLAREQEQ
jgi:hypothetical protein